MGKSDKTKDEGTIADNIHEETECCADGACCWNREDTSARSDKKVRTGE